MVINVSLTPGQHPSHDDDDPVVMTPQQLATLLRAAGHISLNGQITTQGIKEIHRILRDAHSLAVESAILMEVRMEVAKARMQPEAFAELEQFLQAVRHQTYEHLFEVQETAFTQIRRRVASPPPAPPQGAGDEFVDGVRDTFMFGLLGKGKRR
jgi:hypothetical protein